MLKIRICTPKRVLDRELKCSGKTLGFDIVWTSDENDKSFLTLFETIIYKWYNEGTHVRT